MVKGGYQIIDFNGVEFEKEVPMQLSNIYNKIEGTNKAILLSGLNVNGLDYRDVLCTPIVIGDSYVIKVFNLRIYISDIDIVTVEDEILFCGDSEEADFYNQNVTVSSYVHNRIRECVNGDFRTFKCTYQMAPSYFTFINSNPDSNRLFFSIDGQIKSCLISSNNMLEIT